MPKIAPSMSALEVKRLTDPGFYAVGGVTGLYLKVIESGARNWILRIKIGNKRRDIGLGGFPEVGLKEARERALEYRAMVYKGLDPVEERRAAREELKAAQVKQVTFDQAVSRFLAKKESQFSNIKHRKQWQSTLDTYASPIIGNIAVDRIELAHILQVLEPIWTTKTETATRVRGRIESVLDFARVSGYRSGENPARWRGNLDAILPKPNKVAKVEHHRALPIDKLPEFILDLRKREGIAARALELLILTAARSGEIRGASWSEIDLKKRTWTIPAERMKARQPHIVPLSPSAVAVLESLPRDEGSDLLFNSPKGGMLSDMTISAVTKRMKIDAVPHGFRSTFRDWCSERTNYPREVAEKALAHAIESKVERAYRRGDLFDKRKKLMEDWAAFCESAKLSKDVISIHSKPRKA